ncbi:YdcH family protein [Cocleimonas flava]|uniref:DUF465 domain-containing protein n=1 Tax=Cocleimonas flava TaxID=634765 RepID=A0A4R1ERH3_9GAMM|nr:DUF465 domain-containing protein [Cocleimonas flava]TCJ83070.1 hypothetical protein EV695_3808 [Cocleimonas flava]
MQGEHHEIEVEFPEFRQRIKELSATDADFAANVKRHNELDNEIRKFEELGQPIADEALEKMKHERSFLKDGIYRQIRST